MDEGKIRKILTDRIGFFSSLFQKNFDKVERTFEEDAIHDLRVCIRRIISFHNFVANIEMAAADTNLIVQLKQFLKSLNKIRDFQVQKYYLIDIISKFPILLDFLIDIRDKEEKQIKKFQQNFKNNLYQGLFGSIFFYQINIKNHFKPSNLSINRINELSKDVLNQVFDKQNRIEPHNYPTYHQTRIAIKKFRYTMEIVQPIYGFSPNELKNLQKIQTILGNIQDNYVLLNLLNRYIEKNNDSSAKYGKFFEFINAKLVQLEQDFHRDTTLNFWIEFFSENN